MTFLNRNRRFRIEKSLLHTAFQHTCSVSSIHWVKNVQNTYLQDTALISFQTSMHMLGQLLCQRRQLSRVVEMVSVQQIKLLKLSHVSWLYRLLMFLDYSAWKHCYIHHIWTWLQSACSITAMHLPHLVGCWFQLHLFHFMFIISFHFIPYSLGFEASCLLSLITQIGLCWAQHYRLPEFGNQLYYLPSLK